MREFNAIGVIGGGTMGRGIAQLAVGAGLKTVLVETSSEILQQATQSIFAGLEKFVSKGKLPAEASELAGERLSTSGELSALAKCDFVIEAIPEVLSLKQDVLNEVTKVVDDDCILATNTSSLSVSAIAASLKCPNRIVGMHFFNPPPLMKLVEVISGVESATGAVEATVQLGKLMGKETIVAADMPGFIVNRCGRPFNLEAQRLLEQGITDASTIDALCRSIGFRMGPLELLDLVGLDTGLAVSKSFFDQSFGEPRWRPPMVLTRLVESGRLGRKTGRGFYSYPREQEAQPACDTQNTSFKTVQIIGDTPLAQQLRKRVADAEIEIVDEVADLVLDCGLQPSSNNGESVQVTLCIQSLAKRDPTAVGFHLLTPLPDVGGRVELTRTRLTQNNDAAMVEAWFRQLDIEPVWVEDTPGLVTGRIVSQLINESAFALQSNVGSKQDIERGAVLGLNYPRGMFTWLNIIGIETVCSVLNALEEETGDDAYRTAVLLHQERLIQRAELTSQ